MHSISLQQSITWLRYGRFGRERCARLLLWFPGPRSLRSPSWLIGTVMMTCTSLCNCECDRAVPRAARWRAAHSGPPAVSRPLVCQRRFASWLSCGGPCTAEARAILLLTLLVMWGMGLLIGAFVSVAVHSSVRWHCYTGISTEVALQAPPLLPCSRADPCLLCAECESGDVG